MRANVFPVGQYDRFFVLYEAVSLTIFGARFIIAIILHGHYSLMDLIKFLSLGNIVQRVAAVIE